MDNFDKKFSLAFGAIALTAIAIPVAIVVAIVFLVSNCEEIGEKAGKAAGATVQGFEEGKKK